VIEAEIRTWFENQKPEDEKQLTEIARSIFELPNIQIGSHTCFHPFFWMQHDKTSDSYESQYAPLKKEYRESTVNYQQEVEGSIDYINNTLAPPGKRVEIMQWSGNCRPGPEAISWADKMGVENINGGETYITKQNPTITTIAPRVCFWNDKIQIYTAVQNEVLYTDGFQGPLYGGYKNVIQTFEMTEEPLRLKPVNIYHHFFSASNWEALRALQSVYDWALHQPLHAITAAHYADIVRDMLDTQIYDEGDHEWLIINNGRARTFRIDDKGWVPDLWQSKGVLGYKKHDSWIYVYADESGRVDLRLTQTPKRHLCLVSSTAPIHFDLFRPEQASFSIKDYRPATVVFSGLSPFQECKIEVNQNKTSSRASFGGILILNLPDKADVKIQVL
jgi:hypothetical protein